MTDTVLITGVCGMVGSHLTDYLLNRNPKVRITGTHYKPTTDLSEIDSRVELRECDVRYYQGVLDVISSTKPDQIYHLAAQSFPPVSWKKPQETLDTNTTGTINVFEAILKLRETDDSYNPVVVVACSSAEYGQSMIDSDGYVTEESPLLPLSPYGVSKVAQDLLSYQYFKSYGLHAVRARIFNTTGPKKVGDVLADFTKRAMMIKLGRADEFTVGNIHTERAITDVRDLTAALHLLATKGRAGEVYNICGEHKYVVSSLIDVIKEKTGCDLFPKVDKALLRPTDEKIIFGDTTKLKADTGWKQQIEIDKTIGDMLAYWESKLEKG